MIKYYCDRCNKEVQRNELKRVTLSYGNRGYEFPNKEVHYELCEDCRKDTGIFDFIDKNTSNTFSEKPNDKSIQDKFFELFNELVSMTLN